MLLADNDTVPISLRRGESIYRVSWFKKYFVAAINIEILEVHCSVER